MNKKTLTLLALIGAAFAAQAEEAYEIIEGANGARQALTYTSIEVAGTPKSPLVAFDLVELDLKDGSATAIKYSVHCNSGNAVATRGKTFQEDGSLLTDTGNIRVEVHMGVAGILHQAAEKVCGFARAKGMSPKQKRYEPIKNLGVEAAAQARGYSGGYADGWQ